MYEGACGHGPAHQAGETECGPIAQLGVAHGGEVVHRHDAGGPARGRDDEVGAVHHVDRPQEVLDSRDAAVGPGQVQRSGGHGPLAHVHAGGDERRQAPAPPPRHGEGVDVEGAGRQGPQGTLAEAAHPGSRPEQRRGVDGHPQALALGWRCRRHRSSLSHPGAGAGGLSRPLAWRRDHRPRRRSGRRPPAARPGARGRARRRDRRGQHRGRHRPPRPAHQPRPRHRDLHPGGVNNDETRLGPGRGDLGRHGEPRAPRRRGVVPPRRPRPGHPPLPHTTAVRRRHAVARSRRASPAPWGSTSGSSP